MNAIELARRIHAFESSRLTAIGYRTRTWDELTNEGRLTLIDLAVAILDGHTTYHDEPIAEWVLNLAKDTP